eukprot:gene6266-8473_t
MTLPAARADDGLLRAWVIGVGMAWSVAFVAIALTFELQLYADGAMFSYAVAVEDVWAFHWHNISGRLSVYLLTLLPAELVVRLSGNPGAGIVANFVGGWLATRYGITRMLTVGLVTPYPPGIPLLIPGEVFNKKIVDYL